MRKSISTLPLLNSFSAMLGSSSRRTNRILPAHILPFQDKRSYTTHPFSAFFSSSTTATSTILSPTPIITKALYSTITNALQTPLSYIKIYIQLLEELLGSILRAVPKKKTTKRTRRVRQTGKALKLMHNIGKCPVCQNPKLMHHVCANCLAQYKKSEARRLSIRQ